MSTRDGLEFGSAGKGAAFDMPQDHIHQKEPENRTTPERLLETVTLKSGPQGLASPLIFAPASVNLFVGPNHSGKSLFLREVRAAFQNPEQAVHRKVLQDITFVPFDDKRRSVLADEIRQASQLSRDRPDANVVLMKGYWSQEFGRDHFKQLLDGASKMRDVGDHEHFRKFFLAGSFLTLGGAERLNMLQPTKREPPHPSYYVNLLSRLFYSDEKRQTVQTIIKEAFGYYFVVDPLGENFEAKISAVAPSSSIERSLSSEAVEFFGTTISINEMSDGVRAFCGSIAAVVVEDAKVILIDEPEAFLHPALCVKLAKELCKRAQKNGQQLFIATHSASFLMGCVQAGVDLNIVRLTYRDGAATSRVLPQKQIVPLMRQPLLRSIGALTGIFYESVIVTEADSDRAFYDEINHRCLNAGDERAIPDVLFLNAQNWQTTARIIAPLRDLGVAAAAIVDIDLLLEGKSDAFQTLMESAGMPPSSRTALGQLRGDLHRLVKPLAEKLKSEGASCLSGTNRRDLQNFIDQLATVGVFVVPVGELESWLPTLTREPSSGKNEWLVRTFEAMGENANDDSYVQPTSGDVWDFIGHIRKWLHDPARMGMPE